MKSEKKNEWQMIGILLLFAAAAFVLISFLKQPGAKVLVTVDGHIYAELNLNETNRIDIKNGKGGYNRLRVSDGSASMIEANCPDLLCVHQKEISLSGETLVCLPHKVVVEVIKDESSPEENALDGIAN